MDLSELGNPILEYRTRPFNVNGLPGYSRDSNESRYEYPGRDRIHN
jgi:hypothetical protein